MLKNLLIVRCVCNSGKVTPHYHLRYSSYKPSLLQVTLRLTSETQRAVVDDARVARVNRLKARRAPVFTVRVVFPHDAPRWTRGSEFPRRNFRVQGAFSGIFQHRRAEISTRMNNRQNAVRWLDDLKG